MHSFQLGMFYDSMTALSAFIVVCQAENCYHTHLSNAQVTLLPCVSQEKKKNTTLNYLPGQKIHDILFLYFQKGCED